MQRIVYVTDSLMAGGAEQQLVELVSRLDRHRFEPYVICLYGIGARRSLHFLDSLKLCNVPVVIFDLDWTVGAKLVGIVRLICEIWKIRPQIVQAVNYHSNLLLRLARPFLPSLSLIGCVFVRYTSKQLLYERWSNWLCDVVVCNSLPLREQLHLSASHSHIVLITNGIDLQRFSNDTQGCHSPSKDSHILLMVGRMAKQKAPHLLVEALGILKERGNLPSEVQLWFVGEQEDTEVLEQVARAVDRYGISDLVFQYPPTLTSEIYYHGANVVVLTSLWEGLPSVLLEAFAASCPVIISEAANCAGLVVNGVNGWIFRTGDVEHLAQVVSSVLALPSSTLQAMYKVCRESAIPYDAKVMIESYSKLYESLRASS